MSTERIDRIIVHTDSFVKGFFYEYRWLSNFHVCEVFYEELMYNSSENAYQSAKTDDPYVKSLLQKMSPKEGKKFSREIKVRKDWDKVKKNIMYQVLFDKFTRNEDLRKKLIDTGEKYLEETNYWNDQYYGVCDGKGKNVLGELLMKIREEINTNLFRKATSIVMINVSNIEAPSKKQEEEIIELINEELTKIIDDKIKSEERYTRKDI